MLEKKDWLYNLRGVGMDRLYVQEQLQQLPGVGRKVCVLISYLRFSFRFHCLSVAFVAYQLAVGSGLRRSVFVGSTRVYSSRRACVGTRTYDTSMSLSIFFFISSLFFFLISYSIHFLFVHILTFSRRILLPETIQNTPIDLKLMVLEM